MNENLAKGDSSLIERQSFRVSDIPLILYAEISSRFGIGEEESSPNSYNGLWKRRILNQELPFIGFKGTTGFEKSYERFHFELWPFHLSEIKDPEERDYHRRRPTLRISAGPRSGGVWAYGRGNLMVEAVNADLKLDDVNLANPSIRFVARFAAMILFRASQIACDPRCVGERYWEVQRNPTGDFTGEDDEY